MCVSPAGLYCCTQWIIPSQLDFPSSDLIYAVSHLSSPDGIRRRNERLLSNMRSSCLVVLTFQSARRELISVVEWGRGGGRLDLLLWCWRPVPLGTGSCCWQLTHVLVKGKILRKLHHQCYGRECFSLSPSLGRRGTVDGLHWWDGPSLGFLKEEDVKETSARPLPPNGRWAGISSGSRSQATLLYCQSGKRRRRRCFGRLVS